jgi:EpsI family protein
VTRVLFALTLLGLALAHFEGLSDMLGRWLLSNGYYGHGPLVLVGSLWLCWRQRAALRQSNWKPSWAGAPLFGLAFLILFVGLFEDMRFLQNTALLISLAGLALVYLGRSASRLLAPAWVFSWFMVPMPGAVIELLTFRLKLLAAEISVVLLQITGETAVLRGSTIHFSETSVVVDDVCSGLRTLVTLVALAVFLAILQERRWKAWSMVALSIPIATAANVVRIVILCFLAIAGNEAAFEGPGHEATGLVTYAVALAFLLGIQSFPDDDDDEGGEHHAEAGETPAEASPPPAAGSATHEPPPGEPPPGEPSADATDPPAPPPPGERTPPTPVLAGVVLAIVLLGAGTHLWLLAREPLSSSDGALITASIPTQVGPWEGGQDLLDEQVLEVLGTRDAVMRNYQHPDQDGQVGLYVVYASGDIFQVAHPPERCFQGGGFVQRDRSVTTLPGAPDAGRVNRLVFERNKQLVLVYYWYRLNGQAVPTYLDYRLGSFLSRLRRYRSDGAMVRLTTQIGPDGIEPAERRIEAFSDQALEEALAPIP